VPDVDATSPTIPDEDAESADGDGDADPAAEDD